MSEMNLDAALAALPATWSQDLLPEIRERVQRNGRQLIVLDDDPTGTQTVYNIPVLTEWSVESLAAELSHNTHSAFYILTNSRSLPEPEAIQLNQEIGRNLKQAAANTQRQFAIVSRSDSTLRGHFPAELDALAESLDGSFAAWLLIPFFLEGGRYTIDDVHYVAEGERLIPAAETPFAQDAAFGYRASNLRQWVTEKSHGRIPSSAVHSISIQQMRQEGPEAVSQQLLSLPKGSVCVVNAVSYRDLEIFVRGLLTAEAQGKRYLYRTAASFVRVRAGLGERPLLTTQELTANQPTDVGGLVIVGSYVPKTTQQLASLREDSSTCALEVNVARLLNDASQGSEIKRIIQQAEEAIRQGQDAVIFTSRQLVTGENAANSLAIGSRISDSLIQIVQGIQTRPSFLIAKGGITSSDVATKGLGIKRAMVMGQILPGIPVWQAGAESRYPDLPYIVFPGNVGGAAALREAVGKLRKIRD